MFQWMAHMYAYMDNTLALDLDYQKKDMCEHVEGYGEN